MSKSNKPIHKMQKIKEKREIMAETVATVLAMHNYF